MLIPPARAGMVVRKLETTVIHGSLDSLSQGAVDSPAFGMVCEATLFTELLFEHFLDGSVLQTFVPSPGAQGADRVFWGSQASLFDHALQITQCRHDGCDLTKAGPSRLQKVENRTRPLRALEFVPIRMVS